ncbi:NAD(P)-binding protein [Corynespora cassiicola Philippines]|uniref:NAD(P)-binding protein n=1 Tax=Corynespora cassiicola Philippines TaxID=1448308 RepID=A0A2T2NKP5_CORCC|nr:NAD(P)-binding protein [Corynespora cassiicola Philippines]
MTTPSGAGKVVRVGLIGCGEIAQVVHIPTLTFMGKYFKITYLCDKSAEALKLCASRVPGAARTTKDASELCSSSEVDAVFVVNSDEYHAEHAILALKHHKHVMVEKPMALTKRDVQAIIEAERESRGKLMVGYMRRYAAPFQDAVREIGGLDKILYARVRDILGPNAHFVAQSGTFSERFTDFEPEDVADKDRRGQEIVKAALDECGGIPVTEQTTLMWRIFGGLGSHDLSVMREALGMPTSVLGSSLQFPFWNVLFKYPNFTVSYESGLDNVPRFDAHLEVYGSNKTVRVQYDTPYVKGLPVTMHIAENVDGTYKESKILKSYEDPYTLEMKTFYEMVVNGVPAKTTAQDALQDLEIFGMAMKHYFPVADGQNVQ